ncbi:uncharacterized protein H6S33_006497 [Morchella sextelata]|uniref:uncharacterized protein n=1 Tax=Morchella sextelata TaxID=1174677 RepID=UPI001D0555C7|nr:uncharacterized protein H6S33_006497 [Morchella sextelata]KAH0604829.1 hypothetical protein H6S33_006497 [Morchella sextelata]
MLDPTTLSSLKVTELKAELKKRGLPVGGLKQALVERLAEVVIQERQREAEAEAEAEAEEEEEEEEAAPEPEPQPEVVQTPMQDTIQVNGGQPEPESVVVEAAEEVRAETPAVAQEVQEPVQQVQQVQEPVQQEQVQEQAQVQDVEPVQEPEPVQAEPAQAEPAQEPEPVQEIEQVQEIEPAQVEPATAEPAQEVEPAKGAEPVQLVEPVPQIEEPEPTPASEQQDVETVQSPPQVQDNDAPSPASVSEQLEAVAEQITAEQQQEPSNEAAEEPVPQAAAAEPETPEDDEVSIYEEPSSIEETKADNTPEEAVEQKQVEEDSPMAEAPTVHEEAPDKPQEAPTKLADIPVEPVPAPSTTTHTTTEDEITAAITSQSDLATPTAPSEPMDTRDDTPTDLRKRKRRSASPPPAAAAASEAPVPAHDTNDDPTTTKKPRASSPQPKPRQRDARFKGLFNTDSADHDDAADDNDTAPADDDDDPPVPPSIHPATCALYIRNLIRPINDPLLRSHLTALAGATPPGTEAISYFFVDSIKSHALIIFASVAAATRVRVGMHGKVWPNERTRKPLWVDFVPEEAVEGWVAREREIRGQKKWEVVYKEGEGEDGGIVAELEEVGARGRGGAEVLGAPTGPRGARERAVERKNSVLAVQKGAPTQDVAPPAAGARTTRFVDLDDLFKSTVAKPKLYYMPVSEEIARERLAAARGRDGHRDRR